VDDALAFFGFFAAASCEESVSGVGLLATVLAPGLGLVVCDFDYR
jgi:hypothetical protein